MADTGYIIKNGIIYSGGSAGGDTNSQELSWDEFQDLTDAEKDNGTVYYITDAPDDGSYPQKELTKAQYNALTESQKNNGTTYYVTDESCDITADNIKYGNETVNDALDSLKNTVEPLKKYTIITHEFTIANSYSPFSRITECDVIFPAAVNISMLNGMKPTTGEMQIFYISNEGLLHATNNTISAGTWVINGAYISR